MGHAYINFTALTIHLNENIKTCFRVFLWKVDYIPSKRLHTLYFIFKMIYRILYHVYLLLSSLIVNSFRILRLMHVVRRKKIKAQNFQINFTNKNEQN